ncbi:MAG: Gfo/Idh/MocA family oxidoreductase [Pirellulaceae bacterium]
MSERPVLQDRRDWLKRSSFAAAGVIAAPAFLSAQSINEKLQLAIIGCGGRGGSNMRSVRGSERVVALCDVNRSNLAKAGQIEPNAKQFRDFRELYAELREDEYDAVVVSTTEHTHAFATLPALQRKKHVYCEKPLAHNVLETRRITKAASEAGVATQMGTQIHAGSNYRRVVEIVRSGVLGPITEAHVWVGRVWGRQSQADAKKNRDIVWVEERPTEKMEPPAGVDWDLWIGPAKYRPYHKVYFPGPKWYRWWDFGGGTMSDLGSHWNDLPFWALDLDAPQWIEADGPEPHAEIAPASMTAKYGYPARGDRAAVTVSWYQGTYKPKPWLEGKIPQWNSGCLFVGQHGMLLSDYGKHVLLEGGKSTTKTAVKTERIPDSIGHHAEWLKACKTGEKTTCDFSYSGPLTEANHLGNVAFRAGRRIEWDAKNLKIPNYPEAEKLLTREYRDGWQL